VRRAFAAIPEWQIDSSGAFFAYVRHPFTGLPAWQVCEHLAREHGVMLLPAPAFAGSPDHVRVSFANVDAAGIERLAERLAGVTRPALAA
jgi:aspartate/methionine/tyrosine aminotransferase